MLTLLYLSSQGKMRTRPVKIIWICNERKSLTGITWTSHPLYFAQPKDNHTIGLSQSWNMRFFIACYALVSKFNAIDENYDTQLIRLPEIVLPMDADPVSNWECEDEYDIGESIQGPSNQNQGATRTVWFCKGNYNQLNCSSRFKFRSQKWSKSYTNSVCETCRQAFAFLDA